MGYIPPQPGAIMILEPGMNYVEVTCLGDTERRFVPGLARGSVEAHDDADYFDWLRRHERDRELAQLKRQASIGTALLIAFVIQAGYCLWSWL